MMRLVLGGLAYLVPTFALGFVWHLVLFERNYAALAMYRSDIIIPFGFLSMLVQAVIFAWIYQQLFARRSGTLMSRALLYGVLGAACHGASRRSPWRLRTSWHQSPTIS